MNTLDIYVREAGGSWRTNRVNGTTGNSTSSAESAAFRLADKLFGAALHSVVMVDAAGRASLWRATADHHLVAYCWASGLIEFGDQAPEDALAFASGPARELRAQVEVKARHGKLGGAGQLLVPGVPEAKDQRQGLDALVAWVKWCAGMAYMKRCSLVVWGKKDPA